ncbi:hypothetical protein [Glutamicibacter ardleyensis]|uniref:hypothetical protein n=1 Tax=Glutamicibacter ardleyensis TaxID=225894 RepID=UPI003FD4C373
MHDYQPNMRALEPRSLEAYRISVENYFNCLVIEQHVHRQEISFDHFERQFLKTWLARMKRTKEYQPTTIGLRLGAVKAFLRHASAEHLTLVAFYQASKNLKDPDQPRQPI